MTRLHHVNLGVPPDGADAEGEFLVGVLGYRHLEPPEQAQAFGARWYETDDGTQVHLSVDPDHQPAARAHTAIEFGDEIETVAERLRARGCRVRRQRIRRSADPVLSGPRGQSLGVAELSAPQLSVSLGILSASTNSEVNPPIPMSAFVSSSKWSPVDTTSITNCVLIVPDVA